MKIKQRIKKIIPKWSLPLYHYLLSFFGALIYGFPSRKINVVAITGTKGKTSTAEIVNAILEEAGFKTALAGTLRFKIGNESKRNLFKMTMPGRFFIQKFLRNAVKARCQYAVLEMTSEGARQFRHKFISLNSLIFTNLSPEHIESHGSYEKYVEAKLSIAKALAKSFKKDKALIVNRDDAEAPKFLATEGPAKITYSLNNTTAHQDRTEGMFFTIDNIAIQSKLHGLFNLYNMLGAIAYAKTQNISVATSKQALEKLSGIAGRREIVVKEPFEVVVDYAHTTDSLEQLYKSFKGKKLICILGNTGGGRDTWKRPEMAKVADQYCSHIILTNEDPYDEDPQKIINEMEKGILNHNPEKILDRRGAIARSFEIAEEMSLAERVSVLITGKGTDPYIMGPDGSKTEWDDATVVREEFEKFSNK